MSFFHYIFDKLYPFIRFLYERIYGHQWYDPILPELWLGGAPSLPRDYEFLLDKGINAVVDIRNERTDDLDLYAKHDVRHIKIRVPDAWVPTLEQISEGVEFIRENIEDGRTVYVHCAKGRGRSATLVAGYLMKHHNMSFEEAREMMRSARPLVKLESRHGARLKAWLGRK